MAEHETVPSPQRRLAAILAADVEGYSRLMHGDEEATLATLSSHRAIIDGLITAGRGDISGSAGDSVLAVFPSIIDAVNCGVAIQRALRKANAALPPERRMELRIGINAGDVIVQDSGVFGDGVNVAARLESLAEPGGIWVTRSVRDHVRDRVEYDFDDLGEQRAKNISRPLRVFRIVFDADAPVAQRSTARGSSAAMIEIGAVAGRDTMELAFWQSVEARDTSAEYHAYLERYPRGSFASLAQARLTSESRENSVEMACWKSMKNRDHPAPFHASMENHPDGEFSSPADPQSRAVKASWAAPSDLPERGIVVLVVENDPLVRALAVDVLEEAGFEVIEAPSADYAVVVLERRPDVRVVFTDVEMPGGLNGLQLARIVQHHHQRAGVVVGSGRALPTSSDLSPDAIFLAKPYAASALVEAVRNLAA